MSEKLTYDELLRCGADKATARRVMLLLGQAAAGDARGAWGGFIRDRACLGLPFALHQRCFAEIYAAWDARRGPAPVWLASPAASAASRLGAIMRERGFEDPEAFRAWSVQNPSGFWGQMARHAGLVFSTPPAAVLDASAGPESPVWFPGARMNIVESCLRADPAQRALVEHSSDRSPLAWTYGDLDILSGRIACALRRDGLQPGSAVAICMSMNAMAVALYLGIIRAGCVAVSIADSFSAPEVALRNRIAGTRAFFTQWSQRRAGRQIPMYAKALEAGAPAIVVLGEPEGELRAGDRGWGEFIAGSEPVPALPCEPMQTINILFSSGTTGEPKAIPWNHTTPLKCASDACLHQDVRLGDVLAWPTNMGWMMGPWLVFAALLNRATIAIYDGLAATPAFGRFVQEARVTMLGVIPSLVRSWRESGCMEAFDWSAIQTFSSTGECSNPDDMFYLMHLAGYKPVIEYCGGTEIGGGYISGTVLADAAPGTFNSPAMGLDVCLLDEEGRPAAKGEVFIKGPSVGLSTILLNKDHHATYFEGCPPDRQGRPLRRHGDQLERLGGPYYRAYGRVDDTMNLGGIKTSSAEIEAVLARVPGVLETAAVGLPPAAGGPEELHVFAVLKDAPPSETDALLKQMQDAVRQQLNPLFKVRAVHILASLPRTASGKIMRRVLRDLPREK